jgi:hypothetical protein
VSIITKVAVISLCIFLGSILLLSSISCSQSSDSCPISWKADSDGGVPEGAVVCGNEDNGTPLYLARAYYSGGLQTGKMRPGLGSANIPYGGDEIKLGSYEVYCGGGSWVSASNGAIPVGAVACGYESDGAPLYAARGWYAGSLQPGKIRLDFDGAHIPYGGDEITITEYEVLCCA